jgi:hypothetical protein
MRFPWLARAGLVLCGVLVPLLMEPESLVVVVPNAEVEPNNTPATATPLNLTSCPPIVSGSISPAGDVDYFKFVAPAGAKLWARVDTAASNTDTDSVLTLFGPDGTTVIEIDDDDGLGNGCGTTVATMFASAIAGRTLPTAGTYYLQVKDFSPNKTITPYTLEVVLTTTSTVESEPNNTAASANSLVTALTPIGVRTASIQPAGDVDYYSVVAAAGSSLFVSVDQDPEKTSDTLTPTGVDAVIDVIAPDGTTVLMTVDNTGDVGFPNPPAEAFCFSVPAAGTYFIRISGFTLPPPSTFSSTGLYTLMVANCSVPPVTGYYTLVPCRLADTRDPAGPYGGPALQAGGTRDFVMAGRCGIPAYAIAIAVNVTVTQPTALGHVIIYPQGVAQPATSTINYGAGQTRANNAIVQVGASRSISATCGQGSGTTHFIIDVVGYFVLAGP